MYKHLKYNLHDGIAKLTLDRPDVYNAFTPEMVKEINDVLGNVADNEKVYVLIFTGAGDGFCAGADISEMPDWTDKAKEEYAAYIDNVQDIVRNLRSMATPSVAAINGPAIGAGCDFALGCDVRFIASDAILREGYVRVGLVPGDGGAWMLPKLIGESRARQYLLTGEDISAKEASGMGLVSGVSDEPMEDALAFANTVTNLPATAVQHTNRLISADYDLDDYFDQAIEYLWECVNDPEQTEAIAAMQEGREPDFDR